ncbi:MAG: hypothetical protein Q9175_006366 [Cornicularia normoerica]
MQTPHRPESVIVKWLSELDEIAASTPYHVYALIPRMNDFTSGFDNVASENLARAVNRAAFWIDERLGERFEFKTIA